MDTTNDLAGLRQDNGGKLPYWAWPGGYPILYVLTDGSVICPGCANDTCHEKHQDPDYRIVAGEVYYEGPELWCCLCEEPIVSAYGDPDAEEEQDDE
jgi:hypothetical protein